MPTCSHPQAIISRPEEVECSVAMLVMHFGRPVPEMRSHDATGYSIGAAIGPASAAVHHYAVRHRKMLVIINAMMKSARP